VEGELHVFRSSQLLYVWRDKLKGETQRGSVVYRCHLLLAYLGVGAAAWGDD
jgi:hypothetical protein